MATRHEYRQSALIKVEEALERLRLEPNMPAEAAREILRPALADEEGRRQFFEIMPEEPAPDYLRALDIYLETYSPDHMIDSELHNESALLRAVARPNLEALRRLVRAGASLELFSDWGQWSHNGMNPESTLVSPLQLAARRLTCEADQYPYQAPPPEKQRAYLEIIKILLEAGADPNLKSEGGDPALHELAAGIHRAEAASPTVVLAARLLVDHGASLTWRDQWGRNALALADLEAAPELLDLLAGENPALRAQTCPPDFLLTCADFPGPEILERLLALGAAAAGPAFAAGRTPLLRLLADLADDSRILQQYRWKYRDIYPDVYVQYHERDDPAARAYQESRLSGLAREREKLLASLELLLRSGADRDLSRSNREIFKAALRVNDRRGLKLLLDHGLTIEKSVGDSAALPWHIQATSGGGDCLDLLLAVGGDLNGASGFGATALHRAAGWADPEMIEKLLDLGADLEARTKHFQSTPLHYLATSLVEPELTVLESLEIMIQAGADLGARDIGGQTALHRLADGLADRPADDPRNPVSMYYVDETELIAARALVLPVAARMLVEAGASVTALSDEGLTPLMMADLNNNPGLLEPLSGRTDEERRQSCPPDFLNRCAGFRAFPRGRALKALLALGAELNPADAQGRTPLMRIVQMYAQPDEKEQNCYHSPDRANLLEALRDLLLAGAEAGAVDQNGRSALDFARPLRHQGQPGLKAAERLFKMFREGGVELPADPWPIKPGSRRGCLAGAVLALLKTLGLTR